MLYHTCARVLPDLLAASHWFRILCPALWVRGNLFASFRVLRLGLIPSTVPAFLFMIQGDLIIITGYYPNFDSSASGGGHTGHRLIRPAFMHWISPRYFPLQYTDWSPHTTPYLLSYHVQLVHRYLSPVKTPWHIPPGLLAPSGMNERFHPV